jgi:hypothetical protein
VVAFGAILGYILYAMLLREISNKTLWIGLGLSGLADIILEEICSTTAASTCTLATSR